MSFTNDWQRNAIIVNFVKSLSANSKLIHNKCMILYAGISRVAMMGYGQRKLFKPLITIFVISNRSLFFTILMSYTKMDYLVN